MKTYFFYIVILIVTTSCFFKENKQYANDLYNLDKIQLAQKYSTLYGKQILDFSKIRKNEPYFTYTNNNTFQILVFSEDGYIYDSQLIPLKFFEKISRNQLSRSSLFSVEGNILKRESIATSPGSVYSIIEEGTIQNDTVFLKKKYHTKGYKNTRNLFGEYILIPEVKLYKFGDDFFIESKK